MSGPYLIGIDCGSQSAKVAIYDGTGTAVPEGGEISIIPAVAGG